MPAEGIAARPHSEILTFEEITKVVQEAAGMGISRLRLTGGEPLVRKDLTQLIRMLTEVPGIEEISLTTNGHLLEEMANSLAKSGLSRVNVSLDTLDPALFSRITRGGSLERVLRGIAAAEQAGLAPIKINCVVVRGINDQELPELARLSIEHPWQVRFIEFMPVENLQDWGAGFPAVDHRFISVKEIRSQLEGFNLVPENGHNGNGPARIYRIPSATGTLGFISPIGEHFCGECNRLRLTADGNLKPCLLNSVEIPLREALRGGEDIREIIFRAVSLKPLGHTLSEEIPDTHRTMSQIGG